METFSAAMRKHINAGAKPGATMRAAWKGVKSGKVSPPPKRKRGKRNPSPKRKATRAEARKVFDDMYAKDQAKAEAILRTPKGNAARLARNAGRLKKNPAPKISDVFYAVAYKPPNINKHWWNGADAVTDDKKRVAIFTSKGSAEKAATSFKNRMDKGHAKFVDVEPFHL
jgi:hypothetical protein